MSARSEQEITKVLVTVKPVKPLKPIQKKAEPPPDKLRYLLPEPSAWYKRFRLPTELHVDDELFDVLLNLHPEELGKVKMFGKEINTPRYQMNYGEEYFYTGILHPATPIPHPYLEKLMAWVCEHSGKSYKQMIINWYMDGQHYIGPHADSEKGIVPESEIYSITLGPKCARRFVIEDKKKDRKSGKKWQTEMTLKHHDVLIMGGTMQKHYKHSLPKLRACDGKQGPRINITFRLMK